MASWGLNVGVIWRPHLAHWSFRIWRLVWLSSMMSMSFFPIQALNSEWLFWWLLISYNIYIYVWENIVVSDFLRGFSMFSVWKPLATSSKPADASWRFIRINLLTVRLAKLPGNFLFNLVHRCTNTALLLISNNEIYAESGRVVAIDHFMVVCYVC